MPETTILTGPVRSGKTTTLMQWAATKPQLGGILMPDVEGYRMLYSIAHQRFYPLQVGPECTEPCVEIGRFHFLASGFRLGNELITEAVTTGKWVVIDEIGKLELNGGGFDTGLQLALKTETGKLLLVVRDSLLAEVVQKYNLQSATILTRAQMHELG